MMDQFFGRYQIIRELGRGGMAIVYQARDPRFERDIALKILPREFLFDQTFKARFEREARAVASLEHSAIVPVHDFGEENGQPFFVMRFMPGGSLVDRILRGPLTLGEIAVMLDRIGSALDFAHQKGVIHRDVKPANILFDEAGDAYLSDFGIVKLTESTAQLTGSGIVGTPAYMAPEMTGKAGMSPLIDIYALGVTLFQAVTGRLPYESDTPMGLMMAHVTQPIPDARLYRSDMPDAVQVVIERAMTKEPADRYQRAGDMARHFQMAVTGQMIDQSSTVPVTYPPTEIMEPDTVIDRTVEVPDQIGAPSYTVPQALPAQQKRRKGVSWLVIAGGIVGMGLLAVIIIGMVIIGRSGLLATGATATPLPTAPGEQIASETPADMPTATDVTSTTEVPVTMQASPTITATTSATASLTLTATPSLTPTFTPSYTPTRTPTLTDTPTPGPDIVSGAGIVADSDNFNFGTGDIFYSVSSSQDGMGFLYGDGTSVRIYFANVIPAPGPCKPDYAGYQGVPNIWNFTGASGYTFTSPHAIMVGDQGSQCYQGILLFQQGKYYGGLELIDIDSQGQLHYRYWFDRNGGSDFSSLAP